MGRLWLRAADVSSSLGIAQRLALGIPAALLAGAYVSEYGFGLYPCEMCWWQRYAHFAALADRHDADAKRHKFNMVLVVDDIQIEKKDKTLLEPVQFYRKGSRQLNEIVVFTVQKDRISGYLSTPKAGDATASTN